MIFVDNPPLPETHIDQWPWSVLPVTDLEATFDTYWRILDGPDLEPEYRFDVARRSRFDRAHRLARVAIEIDGGTHNGGRHVRGDGYAKDCEKLNRATAQGWAVFRLTTDMLRDAPAQHLAPIIATIEKRLQFGLDVWVATP